jgi:hypothetical protein
MNSLIDELLQELGESPTTLSKKNVHRITSDFPVPREQSILWADVRIGTRSSGVVLTDRAFILRADKKVKKLAEKNRKSKNEDIPLFQMTKWEYFESTSFHVIIRNGIRILCFDQYELYTECDEKTMRIFDGYKNLLDKYVNRSTISAANVFSASEAVVPENFSKTRTKMGHGQMAEEANSLIDRCFRRSSKILGRDNRKNGPDRISNGTLIQTKYCNSGAHCVHECFDKTTGLFRYYNPDGRPMAIEVPKDFYHDAISALKGKISDGKVPGVGNPEDASAIIRSGEVTYQQALNLCKAGTIESLSFDAATGAVHCSYALGITFVITYVLGRQRGLSNKEAVNIAFRSGLSVFGLAFFNHVLVSQIARTSLTKSLIPVSDYLVKKIGYGNTQKIVNAIRAAAGKSSISGAAASKQMAKILRSDIITSVVMFVVFSSVDTYKVIHGKIARSQFIKNSLTRIGGIAGGVIGTEAAVVACAAIGEKIGTKVKPGVGTLAGIAGGAVVGVAASVGVKAIADVVREDDLTIMSRMLNAVIMNMAVEYLLTEAEMDILVKELDEIPQKQILKQLESVMAAKEQESILAEFLRPHYLTAIQKRSVIETPPYEDIVSVFAEGKFKPRGLVGFFDKLSGWIQKTWRMFTGAMRKAFSFLARRNPLTA